VIKNQIGETVARYLYAVSNSCSLELLTKILKSTALNEIHINTY